MSTKSVETILSRAMNDATFAEELSASPSKALAGYDLTTEETSQITSMSRVEFAALATEQRKSFGVIIHDRTSVEIGNHNQSALKVRKALTANHNQSTLKVRKGYSTQHNQSTLKVRKGLPYNHNQYVLKVRKAIAPNHNQSIVKVRKGSELNHNQSVLKVRKGLATGNHNATVSKPK